MSDLAVSCPQCGEGFTLDAEGYADLAPHKPMCPDCIPDLIPLITADELPRWRELYPAGGAP